ncbi:MAG: hypothetical protein PVG39_16355 [Desulfobacteraceae bacterium]|jgi:hypothetical protein
MTRTSIYKFQVLVGNRLISFLPISLPVCFLLMFSGCVSVKPHQQRLVSKPNMQFSESVIFNYQDRSLTQIESGSASFIGGQSGSCGSCVGGAQ